MSALVAFVMTAMASLAPGGDHFVLASAIADEVEAAAPLFADDADRRRTAALVVAVAYRESTFRADAVGDRGRSVCAMQIYGGEAELLEDPARCVRRGLEMLRASVRIDRENPVAFYARGPRYTSDHARRISRDRMALARRAHDVAARVLAELEASP